MVVAENTQVTTQAVTPQMLRSQAGKYYGLLLLWPAYLFLVPAAFARWGNPGLLLAVFPGIYLFTWVGFLMHECWHKYVPDLPAGMLYHVFAWMLATDSQLYQLLHGHHHSDVNTWEDREFHPLGEIKNIWLRRGYHVAELLGGVIFITLVSTWAIPRHPSYRPKYRAMKLARSVLAWLVFFGGIGAASASVFGLTAGQVLLPWIWTVALGSLVLHHSQLIEHGNLIVNGDWNQRNIKTRNLSNRTLAGKLFLFFTHADSREHVLHHTQTRIYSRPFPGKIPLPDGSRTITFTQYFSIVWDMILGRESGF